MYCELVRRETYSKGVFLLDYGQDMPSLVQDAALAEANTYVSQLISAAAALTTSTAAAVEVVSASEVLYNLNEAGTITNQLRYLLRRRTP